MLTCITCSKQRLEDGEEDDTPRGTPSTKDAVKSLTTQVLLPNPPNLYIYIYICYLFINL